MYVAQLLLKGRKVTKSYLRYHMISFLRSSLFGMVVCAITMSSSCLLRNVLGKYYYLLICGVPALLGALSVIVEVPTRRHLYAFTFVHMMLECWIRSLEESGSITFTKGKQTFLFMCFNAAMLYLIKTDTSQKPTYWFFKPKSSDNVSQNNIKTPCQHKETCWRFALKNTGFYTGIGLGIQFLRVIFSKPRSVVLKPAKTFKRFLADKGTFGLASFLGAYIGIYSVVVCILNRHNERASDLHAIPAGFVAGLAYALHPNRTIWGSVLTNVLQLMLRRGITNGIVPDYPQVPPLTFALAFGVLFHVKFLCSDICPRFVHSALSTITLGRTDYINHTFEKLMAKSINA